jgi:hypothetical protein
MGDRRDRGLITGRPRFRAALLVLATSALLAACGGDGDDEETVVERTVVIEQGDEDGGGGGGGGGTIPTERETSPEGAITYQTVTSLHGGWSADLPSGSGWSGPQESVEGGDEIYRTRFDGPGELILVIDFTPNVEPEYEGPYESRRTIDQPAFGSATEIVFSGGPFSQCEAACVDYLIPNGEGGGYAVLAGGADVATLREIAAPVVESLQYYDV